MALRKHSPTSQRYGSVIAHRGAIQLRSRLVEVYNGAVSFIIGRFVNSSGSPSGVFGFSDRFGLETPRDEPLLPWDGKWHSSCSTAHSPNRQIMSNYQSYRETQKRCIMKKSTRSDLFNERISMELGDLSHTTKLWFPGWLTTLEATSADSVDYLEDLEDLRLLFDWS